MAQSAITNENINNNSNNLDNNVAEDLGPTMNNAASQDGNEIHLNNNDMAVRICHCDQPVMPDNCDNCNINLNIPCAKHTVIFCNNNTCNKRFHVNCLSQYFG